MKVKVCRHCGSPARFAKTGGDMRSKTGIADAPLLQCGHPWADITETLGVSSESGPRLALIPEEP